MGNPGSFKSAMWMLAESCGGGEVLNGFWDDWTMRSVNFGGVVWDP